MAGATSSQRRMRRERETVEEMIRLYCKAKHDDPARRCPDCQALMDYARSRLERCPFQEDKPTCSNCAVHCYQAEMRDRIRAVMRYSGPRMLFHHPVLAMFHLMDGRRRPRRPSM